MGRVEESMDRYEANLVRVCGAVQRTDLGCSSKQLNEEPDFALSCTIVFTWQHGSSLCFEKSKFDDRSGAGLLINSCCISVSRS